MVERGEGEPEAGVGRGRVGLDGVVVVVPDGAK